MSIACVASMCVHAAVASLWEVAMLSAPVFDSCEGPKQQGAIADAIFEKKFSPRTLHTPGAPPFSTFWRRGSENFFPGNRLDAAPRWSTLSLKAHACRIEVVSARLRR